MLFSFLALAYEESLPVSERYVSGEKGETLWQFAAVLKVPAFMLPLLVLTLPNYGLMAYVSVASFVYESYFGLSELAYGMYYAIAALVTVLGPFAWEFASRHMEAKTFITAEIGAAVAAGAALLRCLRCLCDRGGKPVSALDKYPAFQVPRCRWNDCLSHQLHEHGQGLSGHASCWYSRH